MLTCKGASYLASKKLDKNLTWRESMALKLHIIFCSVCRRYASEITALHGMLKKTTDRQFLSLVESVKLSKQSRARIKQAIDKVLQQKK